MSLLPCLPHVQEEFCPLPWLTMQLHMPSLNIFSSFTWATTERWTSQVTIHRATSRETRREARQSKQNTSHALKCQTLGWPLHKYDYIESSEGSQAGFCFCFVFFSAFCTWGNWDVKKSSNFSKFTKENVSENFSLSPSDTKVFVFPPETFLRKWDF